MDKIDRRKLIDVYNSLVFHEEHVNRQLNKMGKIIVQLVDELRNGGYDG